MGYNLKVYNKCIILVPLYYKQQTLFYKGIQSVDPLMHLSYKGAIHSQLPRE